MSFLGFEILCESSLGFLEGSAQRLASVERAISSDLLPVPYRLRVRQGYGHFEEDIMLDTFVVACCAVRCALRAAVSISECKCRCACLSTC